MDGVSSGLGLVSGVIQTYNAVVAAYDLYLDCTDFPSTYQDIRIGFLIERYRLELWATEIISERYVRFSELLLPYLDTLPALEPVRRG